MHKSCQASFFFGLWTYVGTTTQLVAVGQDASGSPSLPCATPGVQSTLAGMNMGFQDAKNLAWKLVLAIKCVLDWLEVGGQINPPRTRHETERGLGRNRQGIAVRRPASPQPPKSSSTTPRSLDVSRDHPTGFGRRGGCAPKAPGLPSFSKTGGYWGG